MPGKLKVNDITELLLQSPQRGQGFTRRKDGGFDAIFQDKRQSAESKVAHVFEHLPLLVQAVFTLKEVVLYD